MSRLSLSYGKGFFEGGSLGELIRQVDNRKHATKRSAMQVR